MIFRLSTLPALLLFGAIAMSQTSSYQQSPTTGANVPSAYDKLVDAYFDGYFRFHPTRGTAAGLHQYETMLEDYSQRSREAEIAFLNEERQRFGGLDPDHLDEERRADLQLVLNNINAQLLELEVIRSWQHNPDTYSSGPTRSIFILMSRNFALPEQRLRDVIEREQKMPANFAAAKANLKDVPKIYTEIALQQVPGIIRFFQNDVPLAFKSVTDTKLLADFKASNDKVVFELERYQDFLKSDLLPISNGDFRIGAENYRKKLQYEQMVDIPLEPAVADRL